MECSIKMIRLSVLLLIMAILIGSCSVPAESRHPQPKKVQVSLRAKWSGTALLLEAGELLANERKDLYWEFVRLWLESDDHLTSATAKDCFQEIIKYGKSFLSGILGSFFEFSLILRSASTKLVLYRQLAQESISSFSIAHEDNMNVGNVSYTDMAKDLDRWTVNKNPNAPKGKCCWVDAGSNVFLDMSELSAWLSTSKTLRYVTEEPEIFDFDHIYPGTNKRSPIAILYGALGTSCFSDFHSILVEASEKGN